LLYNANFSGRILLSFFVATKIFIEVRTKVQSVMN